MTPSFRVAIVLLISIVSSGLPASVAAQTDDRPVAWSVARQVLIDPSTYVPATVSAAAKLWDWRTSQVLFANGWVEQNPRFTRSGLPYDVPISYGDGRQQIMMQSLGLLEACAAHNVAVAVVERVLITQHPGHRKLIRTLGWIERAGVGGYLTYIQSANHFRQAQKNLDLTRRYGY